MKTLFISDLHLSENEPTITHLFLTFLQNMNAFNDLDALYILGDLFEVWIGDDDQSEFNRHIQQALKKVTDSGIPVYFIHGNRDFLIGKKFLKDTGCVLLPEEQVINLYGTPTLLMHGDTLCISDLNYLKFRKKVRTWWCQKLFLWKPLKKRKEIASTMRKESQAYMRTAPDHIMDVTQSEVERVMQKHGVQFLIHGHTHRPNTHHFQVNNAEATRIVLGAWHERLSVLEWDDQNNRELVV